MNASIQQLLNTTKHDLKMALAEPVQEPLLLECIRLVERGAAVTLVISADDEQRLRENVFLFNKCLIFLKKGGEIYFHRAPFALAIGDYRRVASPEKNSAEVSSCLRLFNELVQSSTCFLDDPEDIHIHFNITDDIILKGDEVTLSWEVTNATTVIIEGIGEVEAVGSKKMRPGSDTIFRIGAYNAAQSKLKTACVKVYDNIDIHYDLSFANARTGEFSSLIKEDNYPHVFGVASSNRVKIKWHVKDSNEVRLLPFGINEASGEHEFLPEGNMVIEIKAKVLQRVFTRKIQLLVFPIPVLSKHLTEVMTKSKQQPSATTPDLTEVITQIRQRQVSYHQSLNKIKQTELQKYSTLLREIGKITFDKSDNKFNLEDINRTVFDRLKRYYSHEPGIVEVIDSIRSYYGNAPTGK